MIEVVMVKGRSNKIVGQTGEYLVAAELAAVYQLHSEGFAGVFLSNAVRLLAVIDEVNKKAATA